MSLTRRVKITRHGPDFRYRVIEFGASKGSDEKGLSTGDEHFTVAQQGRGLLIASSDEATGSAPGPVRRVVKLRAAVTGKSSCDEHLAVMQQRSRMHRMWDGEAAGLLECEGSA